MKMPIVQRRKNTMMRWSSSPETTFFKNILVGPGTVVQACYPSYLGGRDQERSWFEASQAKSSSDPSQPMVDWMQWHLTVIPAMWGTQNRRILVQASTGLNKARPYLKNTKTKHIHTKDRRHGFSDGVSAQQAQGPEFNLRYSWIHECSTTLNCTWKDGWDLDEQKKS
jgi:hypothetical protein